MEHDPPLSFPGMVNVQLDTRGRLRGLQAAPPKHDDSSPVAEDVDWAPLFTAAGLEPGAFTRVEPAWLPPSYADSRAAWEGVYPDAPEISIRIEAAAYRGRAVAFRIFEPWSEPAASTESGWVRASDTVPSASERLAFNGSYLLLILTLTLLARRNLKLGRGDRKLAFRLASVLASMMMVHWLLAAHHVPESSQLQIFFGGLYRSSFVFALAGLMYLALEPSARKLWPRALISWVRLLNGRFRDPIVGRDVLVGCVQGIGIGFIAKATRMASLWWGGVPPRPDFPPHPAELLALRGVRESTAELIQVQVNIATHILFLFIALLLLRLIFRKTWIAVAIHGSLYVFVYGPGFGYLYIAIAITAWHVVFFRFGWLPILVSTVCADSLQGFPLTTDLSAWYAHATILVSVFCLALTIYGFKVSLVGRPVFKDLLAEG